MTKKAASQAEVISLWDAFSISDSSTNNGHPNNFQNCLVWPGCTDRSHFDDDYLSLRDELSLAAYDGRWIKVFEVLQNARTKYAQSWVNYSRLSEQNLTAVSCQNISLLKVLMCEINRSGSCVGFWLDPSSSGSLHVRFGRRNPQTDSTWGTSYVIIT
jgi:hypothetical protein